MIRVNERYGIEALPDQYTVYEFKIAKKGKSAGKEKAKMLGYFYALPGALKAIRDDMVRAALLDKDMSLHEAINMVKRIDEEFWQNARKEFGDV